MDHLQKKFFSALARLLNEKGLELSGEKLAHLLHRLERQGVLHREEDSYTQMCRPGISVPGNRMIWYGYWSIGAATECFTVPMLP